MCPPKVFIIILNYNGKELLKECLNSVLSSDYKNFETILIDNASSDGSFEMAKTHYPKAIFIQNKKNIGFGSGNNIAIRFALERQADYIFLLNNDALIEKETLSRLVEVAENDPKIGLLNPLIYHGKESKIWFAGGKIDWIRMKTAHLTAMPRKDVIPTEFSTGCALLIKKDVFKKVGLFDEDYFLYYEDADLSVRAQKKGFVSAVTKKTKTFHYEKSEDHRDEKIYWLVLSGLIFFNRNAPDNMKMWISFLVFARKICSLFKKNDTISFNIKKAFIDFRHVN